MRPLSASQVKQIAGRAGRFGLHGSGTTGVVTTLRPEDLDFVREALGTSFEPLQTVRLNLNYESYRKITEVLPWDSPNMTVAEVYHYVSRMSPLFEFQSIYELEQSFEFIEEFVDCLTLRTRLLTTNSPCPWRDALAVDGARSMMKIYRDKLRVPIEDVLHRAQLLKKLNAALVLMEGGGPVLDQKAVVRVLGELETVHKVIVLYLWFSYRHQVAFPDQEKGFDLKHVTELAMDWCLELLHQMRTKAKDPGSQARRAVLDRRPLKRPDVSVEGPTLLLNREPLDVVLEGDTGMLSVTRSLPFDGCLLTMFGRQIHSPHRAMNFEAPPYLHWRDGPSFGGHVSRILRPVLWLSKGDGLDSRRQVHHGRRHWGIVRSYCGSGVEELSSASGSVRVSSHGVGADFVKVMVRYDIEV